MASAFSGEGEAASHREEKPVAEAALAGGDLAP